MQALLDTIANNRAGKATGIYSVCCAHALVIEAALDQARDDDTVALIEATANQVNQFGGYTGMQPEDFRQFVHSIAEETGFDTADIILGGDHLGPVCWTSEPAASAMEKSRDLIAAYVKAGFKKIHLDCSMPCSDDKTPLADEIIAERAADLCCVAEETAVEAFGSSEIVYIVGTEVPPPGGTHEEEPKLEITDPAHAHQTVALHKVAFAERGLASTWERVVGLVVQPGVEFSHTTVIQYDRDKAAPLKELLPTLDNFVFEAHSTDYQLPENYRHLVEDHFAILKVGPQLTFALREALFALSHIEDILVDSSERSNLRNICEYVMIESPMHWQKFYPVPENELPFYRQFSLSDRIRYYWPDQSIRAAVDRLVKNLSGTAIPLPLISQFLPDLYWDVVAGQVANEPLALVKAKIKRVAADYSNACWKQHG